MSNALIGPGETILLIGDTGDGKTAQIGELAEHLWVTTKLPSRIYTADSGRAWKTVAPYVELGIIEVIELSANENPHQWLNASVQGQERNGTAWKPGKPVAMNVFEGFTSIGGKLMDFNAKAAAAGGHKAGEDRFVLKTGVGDEKIASNNRTDYNLVQIKLRDAAQQSMGLNSVIVWTAALNRAQDEGMTTVMGPLLVGNAMSAIAPMWFQLTFRVAAIPQSGQAPRHVLYLEDHLDASAGMAKGLGNARVPLAGTNIAVPFSIEPASIVAALGKLNERKAAAKAEIAKRVGLKTA